MYVRDGLCQYAGFSTAESNAFTDETWLLVKKDFLSLLIYLHRGYDSDHTSVVGDVEKQELRSTLWKT
jgi:methylmalonyl-CoA mutase N-terminal domain/subunit